MINEKGVDLIVNALLVLLLIKSADNIHLMKTPMTAILNF